MSDNLNIQPFDKELATGFAIGEIYFHKYKSKREHSFHIFSLGI